jgi:hypothetical protein
MEGFKMNKIIKMIFVLIIIFVSLYIQKQQIIKNIKVENIENNQVTLEIDNNCYIYE